MLKNLIESASKLPKPLFTPDTKTEYLIPTHIAAQLKSTLSILALDIERYTSSSKTSEVNYAIFSNKYFSLACYFYDFSKDLLAYFNLLSQFEIACNNKHKETAKLLFGTELEIKQNIEAAELTSFFDSSEDLNLFCKFFDKKKVNEYRLGAKAPINNNGDYSIRPVSDCFASVVLTQINLPNASSAIFGNLVYELAISPSVYELLKKYDDSS